MDFINETRFAASIARVQLLYKDLLMATVVVKCTFDVGPDGEVRPAEEQIAVSDADAEDELGTIDCDMVPIKSCCDVAVLGRAYAPDGAPATVVQVDLRVGELQRKLMVYGDRRWERDGAGFRPSVPALFSSMPLTYERAFGGSAIWYGKMAGPFADNPMGRGYLKRAEDAEGTLLPNIEEADQLIRSWEDAPLPAAFAPLPRGSALRGARGVLLGPEPQTARLEPAFFTFAHPRMQLASYPVASMVELRGMHPDGAWSFRIPEISLSLEVDLGGARYALSLVADTLVLLPEQRRFYVTARRALVYQFVARRERRIRVFDGRSEAMLSRPSTIHAARSDLGVGLQVLPEDDDSLIPFDLLLRSDPMTELTESLPLCLSA